MQGLVDQKATVIQVDCGDYHSLALDLNGRLYSWGGGGSSYNKGQCGHGHLEDVESPEQIKALAHLKVT